ncbi:MAG: hypothetical protein DWQ02_15175 [Bacteroidetes bacterium]|nr:MAG: hypothetical protein DWQ02_15175 [Bacteroidota bacterium]
MDILRFCLVFRKNYSVELLKDKRTIWNPLQNRRISNFEVQYISMKQKYTLSAAGDILPPIYYTIIEKGYSIKAEEGFWIAENEKAKLIGDDLMDLAGLILLFEEKGENWVVDDAKIDDFLEKFY